MVSNSCPHYLTVVHVILQLSILINSCLCCLTVVHITKQLSTLFNSCPERSSVMIETLLFLLVIIKFKGFIHSNIYIYKTVIYVQNATLTYLKFFLALSCLLIALTPLMPTTDWRILIDRTLSSSISSFWVTPTSVTWNKTKERFKFRARKSSKSTCPA